MLLIALDEEREKIAMGLKWAAATIVRENWLLLHVRNAVLVFAGIAQ